MHISIAPETIFTLFGWPVSNAMLLSIIAFVFATIFMLFVSVKVRENTRRMERDSREFREPGTAKRADKILDEDKLRKKNGFFTRLAIWCFEGLYKTVKEVVPNRRIAKLVAPFSITIFFFVVFNYYFGILPFVGEAVHVATAGGELPLLRGGAADLNFTFMLAILTIIMVQVYAFRALGFRGNLRRYFVNPFRDPIGCFSGFLEIIGEFSRMLALSMRLFGNCFAGEVLLIVVSFLTNFASPVVLPFFYIFELFIGGIQAYIFFMLASVFAGIAIQHGSHESDHQEAAKPIGDVIIN
jgi:F-type H+-transporting ATPase subunit a